MESSASETSAHAQTLVNWELAASTAARLAPAGPTLGSAEIGAAVDNLRLMADISVPHVHDITGLEAARDLRDSSVLVVDRASWAKANTQSFAVMLKPAMEKMLESRRGTVSPGAASVSGAITGSQLGAVLAFLSSKVLGQYDPFSALAEGSTRQPADGSCWWPRTSFPWSANSTLRPRISGSGSACTNRPTACSSPPRPGCATTC